MIKVLISCTIFAYFIAPSFASKARMAAFNQDSHGSRFISDARNVFLNPAYISLYKDFITLEMGQTSQVNEETSQRAEGGIFKSAGAYAYGFYFGDERDVNNQFRNKAADVATTSDAGVLSDSDLYEQNTMSVFFGGGGESLPWGISFKYGAFENQTGLFDDANGNGTVDGGEGVAGDVATSTMSMSLGAAYGSMELYLHVGLGDTVSLSNSASDFEYKSNGSTKVGFIYDFSGDTVFLEYESDEVELDSATDSWVRTDLEVGYGKVHKINDDAQVFSELVYQSISHENFGFTSDLLTNESRVRVMFGMEVIVKDWLMLRGSVASELYGETSRDDGTNQVVNGNSDTTEVRAGASLTYGDFQVDGIIGNEETLATDTPNTYSKVSMTYKF
jgi:hypothetical protein